MMIYKCIKPYKNVMPGTYWAARDSHYMFQKIESPSGLGRIFIYLPPNILREYFIKLKEQRKENTNGYQTRTGNFD